MLSKLSKKMWLFFAVFIAIAVGAYALVVIVIADVIPSGNCVETDSGLDYLNAGSISGTFKIGNTTYSNVTLSDNCASNTIVAELVCGSNVRINNTSFPHLAALVWENCNATGNATSCVSGRCV